MTRALPYVLLVVALAPAQALSQGALPTPYPLLSATNGVEFPSLGAPGFPAAGTQPAPSAPASQPLSPGNPGPSAPPAGLPAGTGFAGPSQPSLGPLLPGDRPPVDSSMPLDTIPRGAPASGPIVLPAPKVEPPPKIWEGSVELGVNGTDGNSETFNIHTGAKIKRKTPDDLFTTELNYHRTAAGSTTTANQGLLESRFEHLFGTSPWTWFVHDTLDYDEFKPYDLQLACNTGVGYQFIKEEATTLTGRVGGGTSHEFGDSAPDIWKPEALVGVEFEHKINKTHKICLSSEYTPNVTDFSDFRVRTKASWEILLDEAMNLSLKLNLIDRYDSDSAGAQPNNIEYSIVLLWSF